MKYRILHVIHNLDRAGAQIALQNLVRERNNSIERHDIVPWKFAGSMATALEVGDTTVYRCDGRSLIDTWRRLQTIFSASRPDVVHAHMSDSAFWAALLSWRYGVPFIVTFQDGTRLIPEMPWPNKLYRQALLRWAVGRSAANIAVTKPLARLLQETFEACRANTCFIPNSVRIPDADMLRSVNVQRSQHSPDSPRIITLGRYAPVKGLDQLITAAKKIVSVKPGARIEIYGTGELEQRLKDQVQSLGLNESVFIKGATSKPEEVLARSSHYVSTSLYEGTSLSVLEAMGWRLPIVVSDVPGNQDTIRHNATGLLYPLGDTDSLANAVLTLIDDKCLAARLSDSAFQFVKEQFSATRILEEHVKLYKAVTGPRET